MFRSLRMRNYRLWFFGQTVSQCGTWMQSVAQYWLVLKLTHSAFDVGVTAALQFAPVLLFGIVGGLVADRFDKRKVLIATQTAFTVQAAVLGLLVAGGSVRLWMVWALALAYGFINVVDNPSRQSFVVEMVGPDDLANAVGLNSVIVNVSRIVGPALAGVAITHGGHVLGLPGQRRLLCGGHRSALRDATVRAASQAPGRSRQGPDPGRTALCLAGLGAARAAAHDGGRRYARLQLQRDPPALCASTCSSAGPAPTPP